jgi:benzoate membrane transport protein
MVKDFSLTGLTAGFVAVLVGFTSSAVIVFHAAASAGATAAEASSWLGALGIGVGIPLFVVTMASQNIPGIAVMKASGYDPPVSASTGWTGAATLIVAPFGGFALNLAAITAAICMGREAHEDPDKRYMAAVSAGVFYLLIGAFAATVVSVFAAFPRQLVLAVAGLALLSTIAGSLSTAMENVQQREPALLTFLVTASGVSLVGIGSAFWGLIAGALALLAFRGKVRR